MVKFLSKSDNFLAKFLNFLKGPSIEYLISLFFELTHMYVKQKSRRLSGPLTWGFGPISGELCVVNFCFDTRTINLQMCTFNVQILSWKLCKQYEMKQHRNKTIKNLLFYFFSICYLFFVQAVLKMVKKISSQ